MAINPDDPDEISKNSSESSSTGVTGILKSQSDLDVLKERWAPAFKAMENLCHLSTIPCRFPTGIRLETRYQLGINLMKACCRFPFGRVGIIEVDPDSPAWKLYVTCETMFILDFGDDSKATERSIHELKQRLYHLAELSKNVEDIVYEAFRTGS